MRRIQKKDLPNLITCVRIVASIVILFLPSFQFWFYLNYLLCGITDVVDGILARKLQAVSETGARLDSFADALFVCCIVTVLWQSIRLPLWSVVSIGAIFVLKLAAMMVGYIRFHKAVFLHTYANKLTGICLYLSILFLKQFEEPVLLGLILIAAFTAIDELMIQLQANQLNLDITSFLQCRREKRQL